jgi:hypothetical protein
MSTPAGQAAAPETLSAVISQSYDELSGQEGGVPANQGTTGKPLTGDSANGGVPQNGATQANEEDSSQSTDPNATEDPSAATEEAASEADTQDVRAPETWPEHVRQEFDKHAKAYPEGAKWLKDQVSFMKGQYNRAMARVEPYANVMRSLEPVLGPSRDARRLNGMDDVAYLSRLAAADNLLAQDPGQGILWIAEQIGFDLNTLLQQEQQVDPNVRALMKEVNDLKGHLNGQAQHQQQAQFQGYLGEIEAFASAKDASGQPKYPYFDEVLGDVIVAVKAQVAAGHQVDLNTAYSKAIRMNDAVWSRTQQAEQAKAKKAQADKLAKDAANAKRAGFSPSGTGAVTQASSVNSIADAMRLAEQQLSA